MDISFVTAYRLVDGPNHVTDTTEGELPGHYEAVFTTEKGDRTLRFLTDKGRAGLLRKVDGGQRAFSLAEFEELTVPADLSFLENRAEAEGGEGG